MTDSKNTFPDGISGLATQYQRRRSLLTAAPAEDLQPLDVDFDALAESRLPPQPSHRPAGLSRVAKKRHLLLGELAGQCELAMLHGMLVSHLRKHTYPDHAPALFLRLWNEREDWLLAKLETRWLISAVITFADFGTTEADRRLGQSFKIFFSLMKLYEAERMYSGQAPQRPFRIEDRQKSPLPLTMQDFSLLKGDLEAHLLVPLWQDSKKSPNAGRLGLQLLEILNADDGTIFRRFAKMRARADKATSSNR